MFGGVWGGLRKRLSRRTRYPAPAVPDTDAAQELRNELEDFYVRSEDRFRRLFLRGKPLRAKRRERPGLACYAKAGLVDELPFGIYVPRVRVFPLHGAMVATDLLTHASADQVFSLMLEQIYVVEKMSVRADDRVLELCLGSGVNSIFASDVAATLTGVDLNPRALEFARFNFAVNPGRARVEVREGSLFEPVAPEERFDLVLVNPPFELVPPGAEHFLHSHGGEDGLDVVRDILAGVADHLAPGGRFEMFTWSPGDDEGVLVADLLRDAFPDRRIEIHRVDSGSLDDRIAGFSSENGFAAWRDRLRAAGFTRVCGVFTRVCAEGPAETAFVEFPDVLGVCADIVDEWT